VNKIDTGGSAFPGTTGNESSGVYLANKGMALRDYHAAAALTGLLARKVTGPAADLAAQAYELADALIAGRNLPAASERENLLGVIASLSTEAATAASAVPDDQLRAVLLEINRLGNAAIREARGM